MPDSPDSFPTAPDTSTDTAVRHLIAEQQAAWNRFDARAWSAPFADSATFINIRGAIVNGRAEVEAAHARIFRSIFSGSRSVVTVHRVLMIGPDAAWAETEHAVTGYAGLPPGIVASDQTGVLRTRMTYVLRRGASREWEIVHGQNTAVLPSPLRRV